MQISMVFLYVDTLLVQIYNYKHSFKGVFMKRKLGVGILVLVVVMMLSSCATVFTGTKQMVSVDSNVAEAKVYIDNRLVGTTPLVVELKKHDAKLIRVEKDGFTSKSVPLDSEYNYVSLINVFWDYSTTDLITGAAWEYSPDNYYVELNEK